MANEREQILSGIQYKTVILRDALLSITEMDWDSKETNRIHALTEMAAAYADDLVYDFDLIEEQKMA